MQTVGGKIKRANESNGKGLHWRLSLQQLMQQITPCTGERAPLPDHLFDRRRFGQTTFGFCSLLTRQLLAAKTFGLEDR